LFRFAQPLLKFAKSAFDLDTILTTANDLKYTRAIQNRLAEWMASPAEEFVRLVAADLIGNKRFTPTVKDQFTLLTKRAFEQLVGTMINERLKGAMTPEATRSVDAAEPPVIPVEVRVEPAVTTSPEEIEGFHAVRAILRGIVSAKRITLRDAQTYCAVLLDDNNRKPLCRLRFNNTAKLRLRVFNAQKEEEQVALESVDDIFNYADQLRATVALYEGDGAPVALRVVGP
jgi:hypothetical protein